jgi:hypothetical protein
MYRSCPLVQNFAKQGLKIRVRKESGPRPKCMQSNKKVIPRSSDTATDLILTQPTISNILNIDTINTEASCLLSSSKRLVQHSQGTVMFLHSSFFFCLMIYSRYTQ